MAIEPIALTTLIVGILPHIITAIENFRYNTNAIKSKQALERLRKHLGCLYNLQDEVEEMTRELGTSVPRKLYQTIRALGPYCRRLGDNINRYKHSYKENRWFRIVVLISRSTGLFDPIKQYRNQVEDCEDWYNIALKTLYLTVSQGMPEVVRETQYKEELRQHLHRFSWRAQSGRYRKIEHADIHLCPKRLMAHVEIALDDPTTIATSSAASIPEPRSPPPQSTRYTQYHQEPVPPIQTWDRPRTNPVIAQEYIHRHPEHYRPSEPPAQVQIYVQRPQRAPITAQDGRYNHPQYYNRPFPSVQTHIPAHPPQTAPRIVQIPRSHPAMPTRRLEPHPTYEDPVPDPRPIQQPDSVISHPPSLPPRHYPDVDPRIYHQSRSRSRSTSPSSSVVPKPHKHQRSDVHEQNRPPVSYYYERETQPTSIHYSDDDQRQHQSSTRGRLSSINRDFSVVQELPRHQTPEVGRRVNPPISNNSHRDSSHSRSSSISRSDFTEASSRPRRSEMSKPSNTPIFYESDREHSSARSRSSLISYSGYVEESSRLPKSRADERRYPPISLETHQGGLGRHRKKPNSRSVSRNLGYGSISGQSSDVTGSSMDESARGQRSSGESSARSHHSRHSAKPPRGRHLGYDEELSRYPRDRPSKDDRQPLADYIQDRRLGRSRRRDEYVLERNI